MKYEQTLTDYTASAYDSNHTDVILFRKLSFTSRLHKIINKTLILGGGVKTCELGKRH